MIRILGFLVACLVLLLWSDLSTNRKVFFLFSLTVYIANFNLDVAAIHSYMPIVLYLMQGYDILFQASSIRSICPVPRISSARSHLVHVRSHSTHHRLNYHFPYRIPNVFKGTPLSHCNKCGERARLGYCRHAKQSRFRIRASLDVASAVDVINDLGLDTLTFLGVTVLVVPGFRRIKASPVSFPYQWGHFVV